MAYSVTLPELGESVTEGTVTRWLKQEGDRVEVDEPLLEISTDKVDTEVPSPVAGTLLRIVAREDETVEVGGELAVIDDGSGGEADSGATAAAPSTPSEPSAPSAPSESQPAQPEPQAAAPSAPSGAAAGTPVTLPELGESVTEGTVTRWLKQVGDTVEVDEPLLEISTDKVDTEVPSPVAGTLLEITVGEDETVEVGAQLAVVGPAGAAPAPQAPAAQPEPEPQPAPAPQAPQAQPAPAPQPAPQPEPQPKPAPAPQPAPSAPAPAPQQAPAAPAAPAKREGGSTPYVTPLVRKLAAEHGIDLSTVKGTGVGGRIRKQDVLAAAEAKQQEAAKQQAPAAPATPSRPAPTAVSESEKAALRGTVQKASRIRQITAAKTKESLQISAQLTQVHEVDVTKVAQLRQRAKAAFREREGVNLTFLPFFAKATVEALKQHPNVNASYNEETKEITYHGSINLGIAVDTERGLLSVVIHDAGELSLSGLAHRIADLAERARNNKVTPDELTGGTFTITNLGSNGALFDTPIIVQPQSGILGVGAVVRRPVVVTDAEGNDTIAIRSMAYLPLTYDHRLIDGADAGRFLTTIKQRLEEGNFEDELGL
ncbi:2-oxoglutarate dehydrogenase, E2 component, dihydrolipoamide succinyltransferase [Saccharomonospora viridis]|jgi:pyruvate dehydrogenase E2 component (dihydrolipoamide acetyltransferase)|uniref:Dihydrolipoamide acetyltransferase component of pyruvate dehydrogenase complex n=1 Tax=Saccharomonospora viridis (strain ATCC 15386 / DSM 43017 / JCM 3036 / CCUG 5913 / NBRC 12207 / NCIMB 9602 / P101) TaxID=471857 RepID=C7MYY4_SACVD|nr:2-oxoglutarate dehydrogenase, E2 component, dihydrolipoamide succinyltransferase [Saccharomonospora viridis]ACU96105.1 2-oxoglutarate dehydrogenase E2 component [Saccharomonospora viridis DSM 43017]